MTNGVTVANERLTPDQMALADRLFIAGADAAFSEAEWDERQIEAFVTNPAVREYVEQKLRHYGDEDAIESRARFVGRQQLVRMIPAALQILADAMRGPKYLRNKENGAIEFDVKGNPYVEEMPPSVGQTDAAAQVLDRIGLGPKQQQDTATRSVTLSMLLDKHARSVQIKYAEGSNDTQKAITREKLRNILARRGGPLLAVAKQMLANQEQAERRRVKARVRKATVKALPAPVDGGQANAGV